MSNAATWIIRPARPEDISFIYATWLNSYRVGSGLGLASGKHAYYLTYNCIIDHILGRDETIPLVAALSEDPDIILGYLVCDPVAIHYVFVKEPFRRLGVARALYAACYPCLPTTITHRTKQAADILTQYPQFTYDPSRLFSEPKGGLPHGKSPGNSRIPDRDLSPD